MKVTSVGRVLFKMCLPSHEEMTIITRWELCKNQIILGQNQFSLIAQGSAGEYTSAFKPKFIRSERGYVLVQIFFS